MTTLILPVKADTKPYIDKYRCFSLFTQLREMLFSVTHILNVYNLSRDKLSNECQLVHFMTFFYYFSWLGVHMV